MRLTMTMSLPREHRSVTHARHVLVTLLGVTDTAAGCRDHLEVLITEACANAILYAGHDAPIELAITLDDHTCAIEVGNSDAALNRRLPASPPHPLAESGRGLPLIMALADSAEFSNPRPGWLVLRITKHLTFESAADAHSGHPRGRCQAAAAGGRSEVRRPPHAGPDTAAPPP